MDLNVLLVSLMIVFVLYMLKGFSKQAFCKMQLDIPLEPLPLFFTFPAGFDACWKRFLCVDCV